MISGDDSTRILREVEKGIVTSPDDTPEQRMYRDEIVISVEKINSDGSMVEPQTEMP